MLSLSLGGSFFAYGKLRGVTAGHFAAFTIKIPLLGVLSKVAKAIFTERDDALDDESVLISVSFQSHLCDVC